MAVPLFHVFILLYTEKLDQKYGSGSVTTAVTLNGWSVLGWQLNRDDCHGGNQKVTDLYSSHMYSDL